MWFPFAVMACVQNKDRVTDPVSVEESEETPLENRFVLDFPLLERELFSQNVGVDHDPIEQEGALGGLDCMDYLDFSIFSQQK